MVGTVTNGVQTLQQLGLETKELFARVVTEFNNDPSRDASIATLLSAEADRFGLWAVSLGLFVPGHGSLDYRVRGAENIKNMLEKFLDTLKSSLVEVVEYFAPEDEEAPMDDSAVCLSDSDSDDEWSDSANRDPASDMEVLLDGVRDPIDRLYKLSVWIRNPTSRFSSAKMLSHKQIDPETGTDLLEVFKSFDLNHIESVFSQYRKSKTREEASGDIGRDHDEKPRSPERSPYEDETLINSSESFLVHRLALANRQRRQQFSYWRRHRDKLALHTTGVDGHRIGYHNPISKNVSGPGHHHDHAAHKTPAINPLSITTATRLNIPQHMAMKDSLSVLSVSRYAPSNWRPGNEKLDFPAAPRHPPEQKFFECPYCFTLCPRATLETEAWKAHLIHDIRPYVCTYSDCKTPNQLYDTRRDWLQHEGSTHRRVFHCPKHPEQVFLSLPDYHEHINDGHLSTDGNIPTSLIIQSNESTLTVPDRPCPICLVSIESMEGLQKHIALHLERFAIFSLPRDIYDGNDIDSNDPNVNREESRDEDFDGDSILSFITDNLVSPSQPDLLDLPLDIWEQMEKAEASGKHQPIDPSSLFDIELNVDAPPGLRAPEESEASGPTTRDNNHPTEMKRLPSPVDEAIVEEYKVSREAHEATPVPIPKPAEKLSPELKRYPAPQVGSDMYHLDAEPYILNYAELIYMALMSAPDHKMAFVDIYNWFIDHHPKTIQDRDSDLTYDIQSILQMNKAFTQVDVSLSEPWKGKRWTLTPAALKYGITPTTRHRKQPKKSDRAPITPEEEEDGGGQEEEEEDGEHLAWDSEEELGTGYEESDNEGLSFNSEESEDDVSQQRHKEGHAEADPHPATDPAPKGADALAHVMAKLKSQPHPLVGWQAEIYVTDRFKIISQIASSIRLVDSNIDTPRAVKMAEAYEDHTFRTANSKDDYIATCRAKLREIQEVRMRKGANEGSHRQQEPAPPAYHEYSNESFDAGSTPLLNTSLANSEDDDQPAIPKSTDDIPAQTGIQTTESKIAEPPNKQHSTTNLTRIRDVSSFDWTKLDNLFLYGAGVDSIDLILPIGRKAAQGPDNKRLYFTWTAKNLFAAHSYQTELLILLNTASFESKMRLYETAPEETERTGARFSDKFRNNDQLREVLYKGRPPLDELLPEFLRGVGVGESCGIVADGRGSRELEMLANEYAEHQYFRVFIFAYENPESFYVYNEY
ncbi:hypothetical protein TWF281_004064 [Arthrobotrys megalospora]